MSSRRSGSLASLREGNRRLVIEALRERGVASRAELARATDLSRSTISTIVGDLIEAGLAVERDGQPDGRVARRPSRRHGRARPVRGPRARDRLRPPPPAGRRLRPLAHRPRRALARARRRPIRERGPREAANFVDEVLAEAEVDRGRVIGAVMGLPAPINRVTGTVWDSSILPGLGRDRRGGRGQRPPQPSGGRRERRQPRRPRRAHLGCGEGPLRGRLPQGRLRRRRRPHLGRPAFARRRRHRRRDRPHDRRRERPRLPLRQPRLPRNARLDPRRHESPLALPGASRSRPAACSSSRTRATRRRGA